jgi:signal peptidase I
VRRAVAIGLTTILLFFLLARAVLCQPCYVPTDSMAPLIQPGDYLIVNVFRYHVREPKRGDIAVFQAPPAAENPQATFVKRVIGLPGDTIKITDGALYRNGKFVREPYLAEPMNYEFPGFGHVYTVPAGKIFVLGDNRNTSDDSHIWGSLPRANLLGRVLCIYWPRDRARWIK